MILRQLIPFIDENQELVIRPAHGSKCCAGTAKDILCNQKVCKYFLDSDIVCIFTHTWKMYINVKLSKEMNFECELMK